MSASGTANINAMNAERADIVQRLRDSATQARALDRAALLNEAADEIVKIRQQVADMRGTAEKLSNRLRLADAALRSDSPTLTDAEREAIEGMAAYFDTRGNITLQAWGSLLRVLLMRWK